MLVLVRLYSPMIKPTNNPTYEPKTRVAYYTDLKFLLLKVAWIISYKTMSL